MLSGENKMLDIDKSTVDFLVTENMVQEEIGRAHV